VSSLPRHGFAPVVFPCAFLGESLIPVSKSFPVNPRPDYANTILFFFSRHRPSFEGHFPYPPTLDTAGFVRVQTFWSHRAPKGQRLPFFPSLSFFSEFPDEPANRVIGPPRENLLLPPPKKAGFFPQEEHLRKLAIKHSWTPVSSLFIRNLFLFFSDNVFFGVVGILPPRLNQRLSCFWTSFPPPWPRRIILSFSKAPILSTISRFWTSFPPDCLPLAHLKVSPHFLPSTRSFVRARSNAI